MHDVRLGASDANEIRRHSYFSGVDWAKKGTPPPGVTPQPIDLGTLAESFIHDHNDFTEATFDHFFHSPGFTTMSTSMSVSMAVPESAWSRWVGWSWSPPGDHFGEAPITTLSPPSRALGPRQTSAPPATHMFTPMRGGISPSVPRTAPRSVPRTRPATERQTFAELLLCVEASAKKKLAASRPPGSASTASSMASPHRWPGREQPPTPTPMSRESTTLSATMIQKAGTAVPRPLSRTSSRTDLPSRPGSRAGHSRQGSTASRGSQENSMGSLSFRAPSRSGSLRSRDDTFLAKLASAAVEAEKARPVSRNEHRNSSERIVPEPSKAAPEPTVAPAPAANGAQRRPLSFILERRVENDEPPRRLQPQYGALGAKNRPQAAAASSVEPYVPPRDPGIVGDGSRLASLELWHKSLENGLDVSTKPSTSLISEP